MTKARQRTRRQRRQAEANRYFYGIAAAGVTELVELGLAEMVGQDRVRLTPPGVEFAERTQGASAPGTVARAIVQQELRRVPPAR